MYGLFKGFLFSKYSEIRRKIIHLINKKRLQVSFYGKVTVANSVLPCEDEVHFVQLWNQILGQISLRITLYAIYQK